MLVAAASPLLPILIFLAATAMAVLLPLIRPVLRHWMRLFRTMRPRAMLSLAFLLVCVGIGGALDKQQRSGGTGPALRDGGLPQWYLDLGYPTMDTDGDGIPEYWERRTRTDRLVADGSADPDNDGVDNAEEFLHQCDPMLPDTDGDGLADREEIDGLAAGNPCFNPIVQCEYPVDESDENAWAWDYDIWQFVGVDDDGFPLNIPRPDAADDNVDVLLTIDSTRHAALTWAGDAYPRGLRLPPCTNLTLRLRIPATETSALELSAAPDATGLWKAALRAEWDARRGLPTEGNRVQIGEGTFMDAEGVPGIFAGVLPATFATTNGPVRGAGPTRDAIGTNPASVRVWFWTNPTNALDHLPRSYEEEVRYFPDCPPTTNAVVVLGWTHDTTRLWIRNLVRIVTGDPRDDETDHCIALDWSDGLTIDLDDYLSDETYSFKSLLSYKINGHESTALLSVGGEPSPFHPSIFHVELCLLETGQTLDRMWIVVNTPDISTDFSKWYVTNSADVSWASRLPKPFASLSLSTNIFGQISADDPEPGEPGHWTAPNRVGSNLHHDAQWEMRAYGNSEGHGNQACYDDKGLLIRSGIAGGTADISPGFAWTVQSHIVNDVKPFLSAVHLDGNPGDKTLLNDVSRPCLHQGDCMDQYIFCRPITQP